MTITRIYIVRHGETEANRQEIVQGQLDTLLNDAGLGQAEMVALALRDTPLDMAFTSDLQRAAKTAEVIMRYHSEAPIRPQAELRERHLGALQGKTYSQKRAANIQSDPTAESSLVFTNRAVDWWDATRKEAESARHVLVVSHGGFISTLVRSLLATQKVVWAEIPTDASGGLWKCWNCSITTVEIDAAGTARLLKYGDIAHLDGKFKVVDSNVDTQV